MTRPQLIEQIFQKKTMLCVGLDPEFSKLPVHLLNDSDPVFSFCKTIIDSTKNHCIAYKPNLAFFEALGPSGWTTLKRLIDHIGPSHFIIADAKRGDIGNTSRLYANAFFEKMGADALTIAPYMGEDSVRPFLGFEGKWAVVLGLTSNKGSLDFQMNRLETGELLFENVLKTVASWGSADELMFVIGATQTIHFQRVRQLLPDYFFLVPGIGAQGGDLESVCRAGLNRDGGLIINASRSILFASSGADFGEAAEAEAARLSAEMAPFLAAVER